LTCWKDIVSPQLITSKTILKYFDGHFFKPHEIIPSLPVELAKKIVSIELKVIDATLEYNFILGRT
jgi:hypothetical protein